MDTKVHGQKLASLHFTANDISLTMEHFGEKYQKFRFEPQYRKYLPEIRYNKIQPQTVNVNHSQI
jgi:hypothetical protein